MVVERTRHISNHALAQAIERAEALVQPDAGFDVTASETTLGQVLSSGQFCTLLRRCIANIFFEVSISDPQKIGAYLMLPDPTKPWETAMVKRFIVGFPNGYIPEFTQKFYDWKEMPDPSNPSAMRKVKEFREMKRGWRSVLSILLRRGFLRSGHVREHFPRLWRESQNWHVEVGNV